MPGLHNVENAVAAIGVVRQLGISDEQIRKGLSTYTGVKKIRLSGKSNNVIYIDDYAHHPEELRACIASARELYPGKRIMGSSSLICLPEHVILQMDLLLHFHCWMIWCCSIFIRQENNRLMESIQTDLG